MKQYRITNNDLTNLSSMQTLAANKADDAWYEDEVEAAEKWEALADECATLQMHIGHDNMVPGKMWARIKEISAERQMIRDGRIAAARV